MAKKVVPPLARLVPPHADKHWSFQVVNRLESHADVVRMAMADEPVKAASPFLQGLSHDWLMVEFWTRDKALVDAAAAHLGDKLKLPFTEGQFTRSDLGLDD